MKVLLNVLRMVLFSALLFIRPLLSAVAGFIAGLCLFGFLFCLIFAREQTTPMYAFFGVGVGLTLIRWLYDDLLARLAPDDYIMLTQR